MSSFYNQTSCQSVQVVQIDVELIRKLNPLQILVFVSLSAGKTLSGYVYVDLEALSKEINQSIGELRESLKNLVESQVFAKHPDKELFVSVLSATPALEESVEEKLEALIFELEGQGMSRSTILQEAQVRGIIPPYRSHFRSSNGIDQEFLHWLTGNYLAKMEHFIQKGATIFDARNWIIQRERDLNFSPILSKYAQFKQQMGPVLEKQKKMDLLLKAGLPEENYFVNQFIWPEKTSVRWLDLSELEFDRYVKMVSNYFGNQGGGYAL